MLAAMDSIPCKPARKNTPYLEGPRNLAKVIKCTALMTTAQYNDLLHAKGQKNYDRNAEIWLPVRDKDGTIIPSNQNGRVEVSNRVRYRRIKNNSRTKYQDETEIIHDRETWDGKGKYEDKRIGIGTTKKNHQNYRWVAYAHRDHALFGEIPTHMQETEGGLFNRCGSVCHLRGDHAFSEACETGKSRSVLCFVVCVLWFVFCVLCIVY
jgi:hypothetical protein